MRTANSVFKNKFLLAFYTNIFYHFFTIKIYHCVNSYAPEANLALHFLHSQTPKEVRFTEEREHEGQTYLFVVFLCISATLSLIFFPYPTVILSPERYKLQIFKAFYYIFCAVLIDFTIFYLRRTVSRSFGVIVSILKFLCKYFAKSTHVDASP